MNEEEVLQALEDSLWCMKWSVVFSLLTLGLEILLIAGLFIGRKNLWGIVILGMSTYIISIRLRYKGRELYKLGGEE